MRAGVGAAGDEVIIPEPCFVCYEPITTLTGGVPVPLALKAENAFKLTAAELKAAITPRTKLLVLPFPCNPSGAVMRREDLEPIAEVLRGTDIVVLSDEIYAELTYGGARHVSFASLPGMKERTVVVNGFSKAYAMTAAPRLCLRAEAHRGCDDKDTPIRHHVCAHHQPVCGRAGAAPLR